jgi:hypothetical protein
MYKQRIQAEQLQNELNYMQTKIGAYMDKQNNSNLSTNSNSRANTMNDSNSSAGHRRNKSSLIGFVKSIGSIFK